MPSYNIDLLPLLAALGFLSVVVLWIAVRNYKNFLITFFIIPLTLFAAITSYFTVDKLLGYPVFDTIDNDSFYIYHLEADEYIYVWVILPNESKPRAIAIPNTEQNRKTMNEAQGASEEGVPQMIGEEGGQDMAAGGETKGGEYVSYDFIMPNSENLKNSN